MVVLDLMHCGKARDDVKETGDGQESCAGGHYRKIRCAGMMEPKHSEKNL